MDTVYLAGGGVSARSLPQLVVPQYNTGWLGYGMNLLTAAATAMLVGKWKPLASRPWLLGGVAFTLSRMIEDYAGLKILQFAQYTPPFQLAGDPVYGMRGVYAAVNYPLPSDSLRALPPGSAAMAVEAPSRAGVGWDSSFN
jgi:hypothetical protein